SVPAAPGLPGLLGVVEGPTDLLFADHDESPRIGKELDQVCIVHGQLLLEVLGHCGAPVSRLAGEMTIGGWANLGMFLSSSAAPNGDVQGRTPGSPPDTIGPIGHLYHGNRPACRRTLSPCPTSRAYSSRLSGPGTSSTLRSSSSSARL